MNKKLLLITALLFLISISAVSAEEINQTDDNLEISDSDILSTGETKSFSDLLNDITTGSQRTLSKTLLI